MANDIPNISPTIPANPMAIASDMARFGVAYVFTAKDGSKWMIHPNRVQAYGNDE